MLSEWRYNLNNTEKNRRKMFQKSILFFVQKNTLSKIFTALISN